MTRKSNGSIIFTLLAALMAVFLMASPVLAGGGKGGDAKASSDRDGDADNDSGTAYTEDNDDDGTANNVEDGDDNAHPSGKDRSTEGGKSGNQGNSESDPDDDGRGPDRSNGGPDKPNGSGGVDSADQDGNNGCGNDDDFEDDNEGWCGKPPKDDEVEADEACKDHWMDSNSKKCEEDEVEGDDVCEKNENMPAGHEKDCDEDEVEGDEVCEEDETMPAGHEDECDEVEGSETGKVTICHATGSMTNPFVVITVSENGLNGHGDHEGDIVNPTGECAAPDEVEGSETPSLDEDGGAPGDSVLGGSLGQPTGEEGPSVLGASAEADEEGGVLPFTGGAVLPFLLVAGALIGAGVFLFRRDRTEQI